MKSYLLTIVFIITIPVGDAVAQYNQQRGSVLGGLAGAAAGAAIGEHNDKPLAGALIGGAVGLVSGAVLGNSRDRQLADARAYQYHQQQRMQYQYQQQVARTVTPQDVIAMSRSGLSDAVIINHIHANGVRQELQVADVITLHENGVSQPVISAMQQRVRVAPQVSAAPAPAPVYYRPAQTIYVEQAPVFHHYPVYEHYYGPRHHHHPSHGFHFSVGH